MPSYQGGKTWRFVQLAGDKRELLLAGLDAPFGRPRKKPVVSDKVEVRENTIYYAGSSKPTRHIYGLKYEPWELQGRIGDRNPVSSNPSQMQAGTGYTKALFDYIKKFVSDQQPVSVAWGDIISATGFIKSFEPRREAEYEGEYVLNVLIDSDETSPSSISKLPRRLSHRRIVEQAIGHLLELPDKLPASASIKPSLLDAIDTLVSSFAAATGQLVNAANAIDNLEKALVTDVKRLRAAIGQVQTAAISLQNTIDAISIDAATIRRSWTTDVDWGGFRAQSDTALVRAMAQLEEVDRQAEIAERGKAFTSYVAKLGDTWELIASNTLGAADKADAIRAANGIRYGQAPESGRAYKIPFSS